MVRIKRLNVEVLLMEGLDMHFRSIPGIMSLL